MFLSQRAKAIKPSPTLAIDAKAKALKAQGIDVIGFGVGEPDFDTPQNIKDAGIKAIEMGFTKYCPVGGTDDLKDAIIEKLKQDNGLSYERGEIIVSCGAKHSLYNIAMTVLEKGNEVIIPAPYWVSYPDIVALADAKPVIVNTSEKNGFKMTAEEFRKAITPETKAVIINSPSNPTGSLYSRKELEGIAEAAVEKKILIISDDIYEKLVYEGFKFISIASISKEVKDLTIVVNGVSKAYAMTGWRIGYAAGAKEIVTAMTNIQSQSTSNPTSIAMKASTEALVGPQDAVASMVKEFDRRRVYMVDRLNKIKGITCMRPNGAFYAFPNVTGLLGKNFNGKLIETSSDMATLLLDEVKVALVPGSAFGAEGFLRLSYATSMEKIKEGIDRVEKAVGMLK
ncbi:MAG: pyridoxal phosphate-dependent aminotransferase [Nitrospirae bacterium]|nr:pyridoxal phosphate-dependent aminotransferase [Nitrospirota bacterium]MBI4745380.1 pyridoxal phosphate-dependent aminotransferase [Deltaproteobacteria bacterium]